MGAARQCMVELYECLFYVEEHGEVDLLALIIPVEINAEVALSFQIMGDGVMILEDGHEVLRMLFANAFYFKVVNAKRGADWAISVCPETRGKCNFPVSFRI